jgi:hypothetical protein
MTILVRARIACAALIAGAAILATAASYGQDSPEKLAEQFGTAADAKAMLTKTVSALKADKAKTVDEINKGEGGFLDHDIYPFATGKVCGPELYDGAKERQLRFFVS